MPIAGAQIIFSESGRGLSHVTHTIFGSTVGYPSDSLASCLLRLQVGEKDYPRIAIDLSLAITSLTFSVDLPYSHSTTS